VSAAVVPFNRLETGIGELLASLVGGRRDDRLHALRMAFERLTGCDQVLFAPSGQCAIARILLALPQPEVVMPAFMCFQVKRAVEIARKRIIYVDLAKHGVNATSAEYDSAAKPGRILLVPHVFGIPTDIERICELAKRRGCVVIEDAVPAFGGRRNGRLLGTFGDFGVFSFQQSKRLPAFRGAAIIVNNPGVTDIATLDASRVVPSHRALPLRELLMALAHNVATIPWIYRNLTLPLLPLRELLPKLSGRRLPPRPDSRPATSEDAPQVRASNREYTREIHPYQAELVLRLLGRFERIQAQIACLTTAYATAFRDTPIATFLPADCDPGGLMRFPIAFRGKDRAAVVAAARQRGVYLKVMWNRPLPDAVDLSRVPNAVQAAQDLVLLPLYSRLSVQTAERLAQSVIEIERGVPLKSRAAETCLDSGRAA